MVTVTGLRAGYMEEGYRNSIPGTAEAKLNVRVAPGTEPRRLYRHLVGLVGAIAPQHVRLEVDEPRDFVGPIRIDIGSEEHQRAIELLCETYGQDVLIDYCGATIPVVVDMKQALGLDPILIPLANDDGNMHGVNENLDRGLVRKGLEFSRRFFARA